MKKGEFVKLPLRDAIAMQRYLESRPIREALNLYAVISEHIDNTTNSRETAPTPSA